MAYKQLVVEQFGRQLCIVLDTIDQHLNLAYGTMPPFRSHSQSFGHFASPKICIVWDQQRYLAY